jgi:hypothetical protein
VGFYALDCVPRSPSDLMSISARVPQLFLPLAP